ncbi:MAG: DUF342 domain-containing protein [Lawsonibacter sp.]|nr:DUF342 domain-containing protein [Lawsonibacter sp.]
MSIKEKITSLLFSPKPKKTAEGEEELPQTWAEETAEPPVTGILDQSLLELPAEHPINRLYDQRRKEHGYLPSPRICLDEDGVLPEEMVLKERNRLQTILKGACLARMKEARGKDQVKKKKEEAQEGPPVLEAKPFFFLSADKLFAWMIVFPPVGEGAELTRELIYQAMITQGISYGVNTKLVDRLPRDDRRYFTLFLVAKGKPAFDGKNGNIVDNFPRVIERILEVDEYDQVDYTALNLIRNVKQGQEICRLIKPTEGEPGRTVLDQEVPAKSGKSVPLPQGKNTEISEDGLSLLASIAGHVEFSGRSFQVKPVMDIPGNVDFSTGNITFLGDVNVHGDVLSGFSVRAMGNIHVDGAIEAGCTVEAGGDLVVVKGILGDGSTVVRAQRCVFSKYVENSTIYVRENLQTDCIINGNVYCDGEVQVRSGRGCIMGGRVWAAKLVSAQSVGSQSECKTAIALGGLPCTNFEREVVAQELRELEIEMEKLEAQLDSPVKASLLGKLRMKLSVSELKLRQMEDDLMDIKLELNEKNDGRLECGIAYPGTELTFGDEVLRLRQESRQCIAKLLYGEIVLM